MPNLAVGFAELMAGGVLVAAGIGGSSLAEVVAGRGSPLAKLVDFPIAGASAAGLGGGTTLAAGQAAGSSSPTQLAAAGGGGGCVSYGTHQVCAYIAAALQKAGVPPAAVISGCRTPSSSTAACQGICGAPSCPGTCAGASSNHNGCGGPGRSPTGAVDLAQPWCSSRRSALAAVGLHNNLPNDTCHFSPSGT